MIICICHRVSDHDIARSVREGCDSFDQLQFELGVATGCGACHDCAQASFHEQRLNATRGMALGPACAAPAASSPHTQPSQHTLPVRFLRRLTPVQSLQSLQGRGEAGLAGAAA